LQGARPLKRWRYVAVFSEQLMACAAQVHIGPARQCFWALYTRADGRLREASHMLAGLRSVKLPDGALHVRDAGVQLDLHLEERSAFAACCLHQGRRVWTRKQAGVRASGSLSLDGSAPAPVDALAVIDDTAGYHGRHTEWWWSAGVGSGSDGSALAWNLVSGVNDPPRGSERAVWVSGVAHECGPVRFSEDLREITAADGACLRFSPEAGRARRENLLLVASDYRAPFGTFAGTLPAVADRAPIELAHGLGVAERHRARW
jgi:hypothetical protein